MILARLLKTAMLLFSATLFAAACGGSQQTFDASRTLDAPAVYRVNATTESRLSGAVSDLSGETDLSAAFEVTPTSEDTVEVRTLYLAASIRNVNGELVALDLEPLANTTATVEMRPPGSVSEIRGDEALLEAPIPLISMREVIWSLFPPLPQETVRENDTWTGDMPVPFSNLGGPPHRMRYVLNGINSASKTANIQGYELSVKPRSFSTGIPTGKVSGEGDLNVEFQGDPDAAKGYGYTRRTADFASRFIRLSGGGYANGRLHMNSKLTTERLNPAEQFGLDPGK